jgi:hypothetical protein
MYMPLSIQSVGKRCLKNKMPADKRASSRLCQKIGSPWAEGQRLHLPVFDQVRYLFRQGRRYLAACGLAVSLLRNARLDQIHHAWPVRIQSTLPRLM